MVEAAGMHDDIEVDAGFSKRMEAYDWWNLDTLIYLFNHGPGYFQRDALDLIQIAVIGDSDGNLDGDIAAGHAVIGDIGRSNLLIWDDDHVAVTGRDNSREAPGNIGYAAFLACAQADIVTQSELLGQDQVQPREDIRQCFLEGEGYGHTTNSQSGEDWCNRYAIVLQYDQNTHCVDDAIDDGIEQSGLWHLFLRMLDLHINDAIDCTGNYPGNGEDDNREQDVGKDLDQRFDDVNRIDDPVQADDQTK